MSFDITLIVITEFDRSCFRIKPVQNYCPLSIDYFMSFLSYIYECIEAIVHSMLTNVIHSTCIINLDHEINTHVI